MGSKKIKKEQKIKIMKNKKRLFKKMKIKFLKAGSHCKHRAT
jgi:hypothetical protein